MAGRIAPNIVTNGLVLYLDASNSKSYISGSTLWNDMTVNGNNGTLTNGPTFNINNSGSIRFDGVNDSVIIPYNPLIVTPSAFTLSLWVRILSFASFYRGLFVVGRSSNRWYSIYYANGYFVMATNTAPGNIFSPNLIVNNQWYNVVFTASGSSGFLYENGVLVQTRSYIPPSIIDGSNFHLGDSGLNEFAHCDIAMALEYNRALSSEEVLRNFNTTRSRFGV